MSHSVRKPASIIALFASVALLGACAVGPDYNGPPLAAPASSAAGHFHRAAEIGTFPAPPPARWWDALNEPELARLIDQALAGSPSVREAEARVRAARAGLDESRAGLLPVGGASAFEAGVRVPRTTLGALTVSGPAGGPRSLSLYSTGFDAIWELDVFGGTRRAIEAAGAQVGGSRPSLRTPRSSSPRRSPRPMSTCATPRCGCG